MALTLKEEVELQELKHRHRLELLELNRLTAVMQHDNEMDQLKMKLTIAKTENPAKSSD